jgi:muconolactone delta-isomerase
MAKFMVISKQLDVPVPTEALKKLLPAQFNYLKGLKQSGKIECNYGFSGAKGGATIVNAESHEELQKITNGYPMFPFITLEIHPLVTLEEMEKAALEMLIRMP